MPFLEVEGWGSCFSQNRVKETGKPNFYSSNTLGVILMFFQGSYEEIHAIDQCFGRYPVWKLIHKNFDIVKAHVQGWWNAKDVDVFWSRCQALIINPMSKFPFINLQILLMMFINRSSNYPVGFEMLRCTPMKVIGQVMWPRKKLHITPHYER